MANPEHVKIVTQGAAAIEKWWLDRGQAKPSVTRNIWDREDSEFLDLRGAKLRGINLNGADLRYSDFNKSDLEEATFKQANLSQAYFNNCNLRKTNFERANMEEIQLNDAVLEEANLSFAYIRRGFFTRTNLRNANLTGTFLAGGHLAEADLTEAILFATQFSFAYMANANLTGVSISDLGIEGWDIYGVKCTYFYIAELTKYEEGSFKKIRIPKTGYLLQSEFEDRFKSRPTIEFIFENGLLALGPAVLDSAISEANVQEPEAGLRLLDITARGGMPRAIIEITERVSKPDALALVSACYQQKFDQMHKEIEGLQADKQSLLHIVSQRMLLPAMVTAEKCEKNRPTAAEMANRNRAIRMAAAEVKTKYDRLPTVSEIIEKTKLTAGQIYATVPYQEGKIAKKSAKLTTEVTGSSIAASEQFGEKSIEHSRAKRRTKSDQIELDALVDQQEKGDSGDFVL